MSSVVTDWDTYVFTVFAVFSLTGATIAYLLSCAFRRFSHQYQWWTSTVYDGMLAVLSVATMVALRRRLVIMEYYGTIELALTSADYVDLTPACHAHVACVSCAAALMAIALLKLSKLQWTDAGDLSLVVAGAVIVAAAAVGTTYITAKILFSGGAVLLLFYSIFVVQTSKEEFR